MTVTAAKTRPHRGAMLPHPEDPAEAIELVWTEPDGDAPAPAVLFVHGHQINADYGAMLPARTGYLQRFADLGFVAAAVSLPGYGKSTGRPDFAGPASQAVVRQALTFLEKAPFADADRLGLVGRSRGAIAAGMVAAGDRRVAALVLVSGIYDLDYPMPSPEMNRNIEAEAGTSDDALGARSVIRHAGRIRAPVLILHGARDTSVPVDQAVRLADGLKQAGADYRARIFRRLGHEVPFEQFCLEAGPFLRRCLTP